MENNNDNLYRVNLLFKEKTNISNSNNLVNKLNKIIGNISIISETNDILALSFDDYCDNSELNDDISMPYQMIISVLDDNDSEHIDYETVRLQSWCCDNVDEIINNCKYKIMISDFMADGIDYKTRLNLFCKCLFVILEFYDCEAILWIHSHQIVSKYDYINNVPQSQNYELLFGPLNVRFFNIDDSDEKILDTIGLSFFGLPDVQCHFKSIDSNLLTNILYSIAKYIFENGDIIKNGHTIQGINLGHNWKCYHKEALVQPLRTVIDIDVKER